MPVSGLESFLDAASAAAAPDLFRLDGATDGDRERGNQHASSFVTSRLGAFGSPLCAAAHTAGVFVTGV